MSLPPLCPNSFLFLSTFQIYIFYLFLMFFRRKTTQTIKRARGLSEINYLEVRVGKRNAGRKKVDLAWSSPQLNGPSAFLPELCLNIN